MHSFRTPLRILGTPRRAMLGAAFAVALPAFAAEAAEDAGLGDPSLGVAVIIGNRNYDHAHEVRFAHNDAKAFERYVVDVLGYSEDQIISERDVTLAQMRDFFGAPGAWERSAVWSLLDIDGRSDVVVFYSGHGVPGLDSEGKVRGYLLPKDGNPARPQLGGYAIETLEANLAQLEARSFAVYLDACFSGASNDGALVTNVSGVYAEPPRPAGVSGERLVVLTAAESSQTAFWDENAGHGMFTHHLLEALYGAADADGDNRITDREAHRYVRRNVAQQVRRLRDNQNPSLRGAFGHTLSFAPGGRWPARPPLRSAVQPFTVETDPANARVRIMNIADPYRPGMELPAGEYKVEASATGYETKTAIAVHGGSPTVYRIELRRSAQPFTVQTEPAGARVRILNIAGGYRPGMELPAGEYEVEASAAGFETKTAMAVHGGSSPTVYRIELRRDAPRWTPGQRFRDCPACPEMVVIPTGRFRMGCVSGQYCGITQMPVHDVRIGSFALATYEVTFAQWDACVSDGGCGGYRPDDEGWGRGSRPVINVSWDHVQSYVSWLSRETGESYRLPSEAEWEYAARAGTTTQYSWGNAAGGNRANCVGCGSQWDDEKTAPVGSFAANGFGLYDMHGNVSEWTRDCWNTSYERAPSDGSAWRSGDCSVRVVRGGSWNRDPRFLRAATRRWHTTGVWFVSAGFRVARTLAP